MSQDNDELQELFDSIRFPAELPKQEEISDTSSLAVSSESTVAGAAGSPDETSWQRACQENDRDELFYNIASLVRKLHDALREIGQDGALFSAQETLPESRERLLFIGDIMEKSANKTLNLAEQEMPLLEKQSDSLNQLALQWDKVLQGQMSISEFKILAQSMPGALRQAVATQNQSKAAFLDILMAQDFQDLAGQTLNKIIKQVGSLEHDLLQVLSLASDDNRRERINEFLEGPQFKNDNQLAVSSQSEVDELLKDLGF